jgi:uncharacterized membrane protein
MSRPKVKTVPSPVDSHYHKPHTVEDVTEQNVQAIAKLEEAAKANRSRANRLADRVASFCGSMTFVWVHVFWFGGWVILNSLPGVNHFDPYPFTFLTFVVSLEAIFLSTFILISQNHETQLSERRNNLDLQINLLTEQENTKMLRMLERIAERVGAKTDDDPSLHVLDQATHPEKLIEQIENATEQANPNQPAAASTPTTKA